MTRPEMIKAFEQVDKETAKVEGVPVQTVTKMSGAVIPAETEQSFRRRAAG